MDTQPNAGLPPQKEHGESDIAEVRCACDCGRLLCDVSTGSIEPGKLEITCVKCAQVLRHGEWHGIKGRPDISIAIYRCPSCRSVYRKIFEGIGRYCKKCHTRRYIFLATNANPPILFGGGRCA